MRAVFYIVVLSLWLKDVSAQGRLGRLFPKSAVQLQFAGSTGFMTLGVSKITRGNKIELGLLYGRVPRSLGGLVQSLSLKVTYNPFQFTLVKKIHAEPFQTGFFISKSFGEGLDLLWGKNYPQGYYWWPKSVRTHIFISSQFSWQLEKKRLDRLAFYFEANTNDLYLYSYFPNRGSIHIYDIIFFGTGIKLYLK